MRIWLALGILMATTVGAYAGLVPVPEIDAFSDWQRWVLSVLSQRSYGNAAGANRTGLTMSAPGEETFC